MTQLARHFAYEPVRFPYDGAIDADGHICEPIDLWETYLEKKFLDRRIRIRVDEEGREVLESDGTLVEWTRGRLATFVSMGNDATRFRPGTARWMENLPFGSSDPAERLDLLGRENLKASLLYPTIGLLWEHVTPDPELTLANLRAYNRWIADFCRGSGGRLVPIAQLSYVDVPGAVKELDRAVKDGCRGAFFSMSSPSRKPHAHPDHDPIFAAAEALGVPITIHVSANRGDYHFPRYDLDFYAVENCYYTNTLIFQMMQQALATFFHYGTFDRFPRLKVGFLEAGAGWIASMLDRLDGLFGTPLGQYCPLKEKPSTYFRRQCFISGDPDEASMSLVMKHVGAECFVWATDFPHPDHTSSWGPELSELAEKLDDESRHLVLGDNVRRLYHL